MSKQKFLKLFFSHTHTYKNLLCFLEKNIKKSSEILTPFYYTFSKEAKYFQNAFPSLVDIYSVYSVGIKGIAPESKHHIHPLDVQKYPFHNAESDSNIP